jgi:hypothetical protein
MSGFGNAWRDAAAVVLQERPDIVERLRWSDRIHSGLAAARLSRLGTNLAVAGFGEVCKQQGILIGKAAGLLRARGKRP